MLNVGLVEIYLQKLYHYNFVEYQYSTKNCAAQINDEFYCVCESKVINKIFTIEYSFEFSLVWNEVPRQGGFLKFQ